MMIPTNLELASLFYSVLYQQNPLSDQVLVLVHPTALRYLDDDRLMFGCVSISLNPQRTQSIVTEKAVQSSPTNLKETQTSLIIPSVFN